LSPQGWRPRNADRLVGWRGACIWSIICVPVDLIPVVVRARNDRDPLEVQSVNARPIAKLDDAIRASLALPDTTDVTTIAYGRTEEWDSVAHMQMIVAIESAFGVMLDTDDVIAMSDYQQIRRILLERYGIADVA
jgi:acyl carrier protein